MAFANTILKNIFRQKARTTLTVLGISIGIATIVMLGILTGGLKNSLGSMIKTKEADFTVAQAGVADFTFSQVTDKQVEKIRKSNGVDRAAGVLFGFVKTPKTPFFFLFGVKKDDVKLMGADLKSGRLFSETKNEVVIGQIASNSMDLKIGDTLDARKKKFKIVGVFQTGNPLQDGGALMPLKKLQTIEKKKAKVTMVLVKVDDSVKDIDRFTKKLEKKFGEDLAALSNVEDFKSVDSGIEMTDFLSSAISFLAIVIGGIGVMNTIMMSVFERTREIGILRAIGWKRRRIMMMVLGESLALGLVAVVVGTGIGLLVIQYIMSFPVAQSFFKPDYSTAIFTNAVLVGVLVSLVGGIYPAYRATRFSPAEALRYE